MLEKYPLEQGKKQKNLLRLFLQKGGALGYIFSGFTSHETPIFVVFLYGNTRKTLRFPRFRGTQF